MKRRDALTDLRTKDVQALTTMLQDAERHLVDLRFNLAFHKVKDSSELRKTRVSIARLHTILREKVLATLDQTGTKE